jgi:protein SCO1/2
VLAGLVVVLSTGLVGGAGAEETASYKRTAEAYVVPDVTLVNHEGARVRLRQYLDTDRPVVLDFFFTSCSTVCPVLSASLLGLQKSFGPETQQARLVSIAIDPEHDTPEVLRGYRRRFGAQPGWDLLTGSREDVEQVRKAFGAYTADKMAHRPLNFLHLPGRADWVRLDGLVGVAALQEEYKKLRQP